MALKKRHSFNSSYLSQIAKLRSSSHDLMIEKGRYGQSPLDLSRKICRFCCSNNDNTMINFEYLPCHEVPILESEEHVLTECPAYHCNRQPEKHTHARRVRRDHVLHAYEEIWAVPPSLQQTQKS